MAGTDTTATAKVAKRRSNPNRGSKPGERRGGREKGVPNKATRTLKEMAREYTAEALAVLVEVATGGESEAAKVAAANSLLDRGYGKPSQVLNGDEDGGAVRVVSEVILRGVRA